MKYNKLLAMVSFALGCSLVQTASAQSQAYGEALQKSLFFYEAQQAGPLPEWNRVAWRGDSVPDDGADVGVDLRGGWFDAGDHVKFGFPMAATTTLLAWGGVDYRQAYEDSGQMQHLLNNLRFVNDFFINAHSAPNELYGQVGLGAQDHSFWGPAEVVHHKIPNSRVSMKIDLSCPGPDLASETAAAMAASSMVFAPEDAGYAATLLTHAEQLYEFAENTTGTDGTDNAYSNCITDAQAFYNSTYGVYWDEMAWGAVWLWRATGDNYYLDRALFYYDLMGNESQTETPVYTWSLGWNDKAYGVYVLMAALVGDERFHEDAQRYLDYWSIGGGTRTPGGVIVVDSSGWGVNRYAANYALLALYYADTLGEGDALYSRYHNFGKQQIDYILGDNPANRSYLIGYGNDYPTNVHHRTSHGSWADSLSVPEEQRHILYGAVVAGPDADTNYTEDRGDYIMNEVAVDYNSGFTGAVAALYGEYGGAPLPESQFPPQMEPYDDEYLVSASVNSSGPRHIEIRAVLQNRSTTPAEGRDDLYFRYFYDLSEIYAAGYTAADVTISTAFSQASSVSDLQPWGNPDEYIYYVEVDFAGDVVFPGGQSAHRREVQFRASLPTNSDVGEWDNSNDPSWDAGYNNPSEQYGMPAPRIPVYGDDGLLRGEEPTGGCGGDTGINCVPEAGDLSLTTAYETALNITLVGSDEDGTITAYTVTSAPVNGTLSGTGAQRVYTPDAGFSGTDSFTYTVTDNGGASSAPAVVSIAVEDPVLPSVAISSPPNGSYLTLGEDFILTFNLSNAAGVRVEQDGLFIADVTGANSIGLTAPSEIGNFSVTVTAIDDNSNPLGASDSITLNAVSEPVNTPPEACFSIVPENPSVGELVTFNAGCSNDADGDDLFYSWNLGTGIDYAGETFSEAFSNAGNITVTLEVSDGEDTDTATQSFTVSEDTGTGNLSCTIGNADVWNNGYVLNNITVTNTGNAPVSNWQVSLVFNQAPRVSNSWNASLSTEGNTVVASGGSLAPGGSAVFGFQGSHSGNFNVPDCITDGSEPPINTPPVASLSATPVSGTAPLAVSFDGSASSDADGDTLSYSWNFGDGNTGTGETASHSYTQAGSYTASLTVSDGQAQNTASTNINVEGDVVAGGACEFVISNEWNSGYTGLIRITNEGSSAINGWQVSWSFNDGSRLANSWSANVSGNNPYTATDMGWNGTVQPGQSVEFGFQVNKGASSAQVPEVTGSVCD